MYFNRLGEVLHMGGYAAYVWPAYGIALLVLMANVLIPLHRRRHGREDDEDQT